MNVEVRLHRLGWAVLAAIVALGACGHDARANPSPAIEYITPVAPTATPTMRPLPTATPTSTPEPVDDRPALPAVRDIPEPTPEPVAVEAQVVAESPALAQVGTRGVLQAAGWPPELWDWAEGIIWRESRGDATVSNFEGSGAAGWFQIMPSTWAAVGCAGNPFDAYDNAVCAWRLYQVAGVSPWAVD